MSRIFEVFLCDLKAREFLISWGRSTAVRSTHVRTSILLFEDVGKVLSRLIETRVM